MVKRKVNYTVRVNYKCHTKGCYGSISVKIIASADFTTEPDPRRKMKMFIENREPSTV